MIDTSTTPRKQPRKCTFVTVDDKNHVRVPRPPPKTRLYAGNSIRDAGNFELAGVTAVTDAARMHTEGNRDSNLRALTSVPKGTLPIINNARFYECVV